MSKEVHQKSSRRRQKQSDCLCPPSTHIRLHIEQAWEIRRHTGLGGNSTWNCVHCFILGLCSRPYMLC